MAVGEKSDEVRQREEDARRWSREEAARAKEEKREREGERRQVPFLPDWLVAVA